MMHSAKRNELKKIADSLDNPSLDESVLELKRHFRKKKDEKFLTKINSKIEDIKSALSNKIDASMPEIPESDDDSVLRTELLGKLGSIIEEFNNKLKSLEELNRLSSISSNETLKSTQEDINTNIDKVKKDLLDIFSGNITELRSDISSRFSSLGGGSMPLQVSAGGSIANKVYADINFVGATATTNKTTHKTDISIASGGTPSLPLNSLQYNNAGSFGGTSATYDAGNSIVTFNTETHILNDTPFQFGGSPGDPGNPTSLKTGSDGTFLFDTGNTHNIKLKGTTGGGTTMAYTNSSFVNQWQTDSAGNTTQNGSATIKQTTTNATIIGDATGNARGSSALDLQSLRVASTQVAHGACSTAVGVCNTASGQASTALGYGNTASGVYSIAVGFNNTSDNVQGATTVGWGNHAVSNNSVALGVGNISHNTSSPALGNCNTTCGSEASAMGNLNVATGDISSASGYANTSSALYDSAFGTRNTASGMQSSAFGYGNHATCQNSSASGYSNTASGHYSSAMGYCNTASNSNSTALGFFNTASGQYSSALGNSNSSSNYTSASIGIANTSSGYYSVAIGQNNCAVFRRSTTVGSGNTSISDYGVAIGISNNVGSSACFGAGIGFNNSVQNCEASAIGYTNTASGAYSSAVGFCNIASADFSTSIGVQNVSCGTQSIALGYQNTAAGNYGFAAGCGSSATAQNSFAIGVQAHALNCLTFASGYFSQACGLATGAVGYQNTASGQYSSAFGCGNVTCSSANAGNAFGNSNIVSAANASAFGNQNTASASYASAFGSKVCNSTANSVQIGPSNTAKIAISNTALTNSRAVFTDSTNTLVSGSSPKTIFDHFVDAGNTTTTETDLYSDTLVAGQLATNGDKIEAEYGGIFVSSATATREIKLKFAGTTIFDTGALTLSLSSAWTMYVMLIRVSATVIRYMVSFTTEGAALAAYTSVGELTGLTLSGTNIVKITGQAAGVGAATNDIVAKLGSVSYQPSV